MQNDLGTPVVVTNSGNSPITIKNGDTGAGAQQVQGNAASGTAEVGNPVLIGGRANSSVPAAVTAGQRVAAWFGLRGQQIVSSIGSESIATAQATVTTSQASIVAARPGRASVKITNLGTTDVYLGVSGVSTTTGDLLVGSKGASVTIPSSAAIFAVAGASQAVSIMEVF